LRKECDRNLYADDDASDNLWRESRRFDARGKRATDRSCAFVGGLAHGHCPPCDAGMTLTSVWQWSGCGARMSVRSVASHDRRARQVDRRAE